MTPSRVVRPAAAAKRSAVAIGVALLALTSACSSGSGAGALKPSKPETTFIAPPITAKNPTFHQSLDLDYPGTEIKVLEVTALTSPNVTYLGAVAVWPRDLKEASVGGGPEFPPPGIKGHHALEEVIPATETSFVPKGFEEPASVAIAVGFRLNGSDVGAVNGMRLVYEVDGKKKMELRRIAIIVCFQKKTCDSSNFDRNPHYDKAILRMYGLLPEGS